jgi:hypothetical protein
MKVLHTLGCLKMYINVYINNRIRIILSYYIEIYELCKNYYIVMHELCRTQFSSLKTFVDVYCLMMALYTETCSVLPYY